MIKIKVCRICKSEDLHKFLDLGAQPIANNLLTKIDSNLPEPVYPLEVYFCNNCKFVQLLHEILRDDMFKHYVYVTSKTKTFDIHFKSLEKEVVEKMKLGPNDLVVDIGSNIGVLLKNFQKLNIRTLGVDPATNIVKLAEQNDVETVNDYFTEEIASKILEEKGSAKVITITNTFSQVGYYDELLRAVNILLEGDGAFVIEVPYLVDLLKNLEFDTIYHEHHGYFSITPLVELFSRFDMEIFDVKRIAVHGGSIRIYVKRKSSTKISILDSVRELLDLEKKSNLHSLETYQKFANEVERLREKLVSLLKKLKVNGKTIVGYGAPAKGNVLLNYCKIGPDILDFIIDKNPLKQGLYTPGTHIPIVPVEKFMEFNPDYTLALAWNFIDEILKNEEEYRKMGGKFIIPIPEPKIV